MSDPPNVMPEELQRAHYIMQIVKLEKLNEELLAGVEQMLTYEDAGGEGWWKGWDMLKAAITKVEGKPNLTLAAGAEMSDHEYKEDYRTKAELEAINAELLGQLRLANIDAFNLEAECNQLRELNAELLQVVKHIERYHYSVPRSVLDMALAAISKAEIKVP